jgi:hypothetical protein
VPWLLCLLLFGALEVLLCDKKKEFLERGRAARKTIFGLSFPSGFRALGHAQ